MAGMVVLVFANVLLRYGFNSGITLSEELSRWLFVWMTFLGAVVALRNLIEFTYDHHQGNEDFIRLVMTENVQRGAYLGQSKAIQKVNSSALEAIDDLYTRGVKQGLFKKGLTPLEIHSAISALTFFNVSNQHTFGLIFKGKAASGKAQTLKKSQVVDLITRYVQA